MPESSQPLGEMLVEAGVITSRDLQVALESQKHVPAPLGVTLVDLGIAREDQVLPILALQLNRIDVHLAAHVEEPSSVAEALQQILGTAVGAGATDIHLEPYSASEVKVRVRVDGILRDMRVPHIIREQYLAAVSRVKIMASLDIAEKRMPQEGRTTIQSGGREMDLRISILPSRHGESVVIRVLQSEIPLGLSGLGMTSDALESLEHMLTRRSGLILVTGPTGCGKTTTLYACLDRLNDATKKIVTIEDPVEYTLPGAIQMQVMPQIDLTFSRLLKTVLRHDPNVIMVGEIRDMETAEVAIRTALTGHIVLSTLHTNDSCSTITRLQEMGVEPYLISSSLTCSIAQRLVRTVCSRCQGKRCVACLGLGLKGRTGIFEVMMVDDEIRAKTLKQSSAEEIRQYSRRCGMSTLFEDGMRKVEAGLTTREELDRAIHQDEL